MVDVYALGNSTEVRPT